MNERVKRPQVLTRETYRCADCDGTSVQHAHWLDLNTGKPGDVFGSWCQPDACWCADCDGPPSAIEVASTPIGVLDLLQRADYLSLELVTGAGARSAALVTGRAGMKLLLMERSAHGEVRCIVSPEDAEIALLEAGDLAQLWHSERSFELAGLV